MACGTFLNLLMAPPPATPRLPPQQLTLPQHLFTLQSAAEEEPPAQNETPKSVEIVPGFVASSFTFGKLSSTPFAY